MAMSNIETLGKYAVIGGAVAWVASHFVPGMAGLMKFAGILIVGGAIAWVLGMAL